MWDLTQNNEITSEYTVTGSQSQQAAQTAPFSCHPLPFIEAM